MNRYVLSLGGDYNINMLANTTARQAFVQAIDINGFDYIETQATRVTGSTSTLIDFFVTNSDVSSIIADVISVDVSDHLPIFLLINKPRAVQKDPLQKTFKVRNVTDVTMELFRDAVLAVNWETVYLELDANCAYESFLRTFKKLYNGFFCL